MDNFRIDVQSEGRDNLALVMQIIFKSHRRATHYAIRGPEYSAKTPKPRRLVLYWTQPSGSGSDGVLPLPFTLDQEGATDFAHNWLKELDYGTEPDHDGDNGKGWRVYNEAWGHVDSHWAGFVAISPAWAMYGK